MAIIKQIAVYDQNYNQNNHWKIDDIGVNDARNVSLSSNIRGQSNIQDALRTIDGSLSSITTVTNNKVSKTGDTMTGDLNLTQRLQFKDSLNSVTPIGEMGIFCDNAGNNSFYSNVWNGANIHRFGIKIDSNGNPIVDIGGTYQNNEVQEAWRKAITGSSKVARMMNVALTTSTTPDDENIPANSYHEFKLEASLPSATDYDWTTCIGPIQAWVHSNQDKLVVLYYTTALENNKIMLTAKVKNLTNNNLSDKVTWKVLWFALYNGTNNI